jgi:short-subunit dehydrogenase
MLLKDLYNNIYSSAQMKYIQKGLTLNIGSFHSLVAAPGKITCTTIKHSLPNLTNGAAIEAGKQEVAAMLELLS